MSSGRTHGAPRRTAGSGRRRVDVGAQGRTVGSHGQFSGQRCVVHFILVQPPACQGRLGDWGIPFRVREASAVSSASSTAQSRGAFTRGVTGPSAGTGDAGWHPARRCPAANDGGGGPVHAPCEGSALNSRRINHLQHTAGALHYRHATAAVVAHLPWPNPLCPPPPASSPSMRNPAASAWTIS